MHPQRTFTPLLEKDMTLPKYDYEKLLDDIKLISKAIRIVRDENDPVNRSLACGLVKDMLIPLQS